MGCMTAIYFLEIWQSYIMRSNNFGIGVLHVKRIDVFFVTSFLCSLKSLLFHLTGNTKRCLQTNIENVLLLSFCDMTVPSKGNIPSLWPWPLTYEGQCFFWWIDYESISVLYEFQINIFTYSREIKYQNIGQTDRQTDTHTGWKQYLVTPSGAR